jgi:tetratricopeptide (TPR) repeat protein
MAHDVKDTASEETVSPVASDNALTQLLEGAMAHFYSGRLNQARTELEDIKRRYPENAATSHFLGLVVHQLGDDGRALELLEQAVELNAVVPSFHGNLGEVYRAVGRYDDAVASCRKAVELYPVYPEALNTLGASLKGLGELEEAEEVLRQAIEFKPNLAVAHANFGDVLRATGRLERAVKSYELAVRRDPKLGGAYLALGGALRALGRVKDAATAYRKGLEIDPNDARAWSSLGMTFHQQGKTEDALECLRKAVELQPGVADLHTNLGTALVVLDRMEEAVQCYATALALKRRPEWDREDGALRSFGRDPSFRFTTAAKLRHDLEQYRYLMEKGRLPDGFSEEIVRHEEVLQELGESGDGRIALSAAQGAKIGGSYNRLVYLAETPALEGGTLNPGLDTEGIEARYLETAPGITYFDDFLTPAALSALRSFCLESTFWFDFNHDNGYLGAYLSDGFSCGLLFQIAEELRRRFPQIFADHKLHQMRAYKYDSQLSGIERRADAAAVNVNFWITPNEANLNPESGGLEVYTREAPLEWDFEKYNNDQDALRAFVGDGDSKVIPYRENRAVVFNSNLVHRADSLEFKEGYENRRINITMLFGHRGQAAQA